MIFPYPIQSKQTNMLKCSKVSYHQTSRRTLHVSSGGFGTDVSPSKLRKLHFASKSRALISSRVIPSGKFPAPLVPRENPSSGFPETGASAEWVFEIPCVKVTGAPGGFRETEFHTAMFPSVARGLECQKLSARAPPGPSGLRKLK